MAGDTSYAPRYIQQGAPQVQGPGGPVRQDERFAGVGFTGLQRFGEGIQEKANTWQKQIDLNFAVERHSMVRQGLASAYTEHEQTLTGELLPDEAWQKFQEKASKVRDLALKGAQNDAQSAAVTKAYDDAIAVYAPKVMDNAQTALRKRSDMTLQGEVAQFGATSLDAVNSGDLAAAQPIIRGNAELIRKAVAARVATGHYSPLEGMQAEQKWEQEYYGGIVRNMLVNPQTRAAALKLWNSGAPFEYIKDPEGKLVTRPDGQPIGRSLRELVGPKAQDSVESFAQRIMEQDAMRAEREIVKRMKEEERMEREWERRQRQQERQEQREESKIDKAFSTGRGIEARRLVDSEVNPRFDAEKNSALRDLIRERVRDGEDIVEATKAEVAAYRRTKKPAWFKGDPNTPADIDAAEAQLEQDIKAGRVMGSGATSKAAYIKRMRENLLPGGRK